jgi:hypothetical protein
MLQTTSDPTRIRIDGSNDSNVDPLRVYQLGGYYGGPEGYIDIESMEALLF